MNEKLWNPLQALAKVYLSTIQRTPPDEWDVMALADTMHDAAMQWIDAERLSQKPEKNIEPQIDEDGLHTPNWLRGTPHEQKAGKLWESIQNLFENLDELAPEEYGALGSEELEDAVFYAKSDIDGSIKERLTTILATYIPEDALDKVRKPLGFLRCAVEEEFEEALKANREREEKEAGEDGQ